MIDVTSASARRRFYLERAMRRKAIGVGSDLERLMALSRKGLSVNLDDFLAGEPWCVVGGVATRAYMPERTTVDIDILSSPDRIDSVISRLTTQGFTYARHLMFPNTELGLYAHSVVRGENLIDVMSSKQKWATEALRRPQYDQAGTRVIPLPYLVLMKLDSARGVDQGDLSRMLGRLSNDEIEGVVDIVKAHSPDPQASDDVRQYAQLGRWENARPENGA